MAEVLVSGLQLTRRRRGGSGCRALPAAPRSPLFSVRSHSRLQGSALRSRTRPPVRLTGSSHRPDCIINVNGAAWCQCGLLGFTLVRHLHGSINWRKQHHHRGEHQPVRGSFHMPPNAERPPDCFIKVMENKNYPEHRIQAYTELPHIYYLSLDSLGTKRLRACAQSRGPGSA